MLRSISPNISVITNWGCQANCWYCVWRNHQLRQVQLPTDWDKLAAFLTQYQAKGKVSVSGGGDCLYRYDEVSDWWQRFFALTEQKKLLVDVHSREKFYRPEFWQQVNRAVFSSDRLGEDQAYLEWLGQFTKIRITHVVTAYTTLSLIAEYLAFQQKTGCQFTIKELVGYDDEGRYLQVREHYPEIFNLDAGGYNIYFMPDNSIREQFLF